MTTTDASSVLIVAPIGKDAELAANVLREHGIGATTCNRITDAVAEFSESSSAFLLSEEALAKAELPLLLQALKEQPAWSDIPVLILTSSGGSERMSLQAVDIFGPAGNVTLLERPLHGITLVSAMRVALRARQRQYEVRELLEQRETVLASISDSFSSIDFEWRYLYVNDRVGERAGLAKSEILGRKVWDVFPDAIGTEFERLARVAMDERRPVQGEFFHEPWGRWINARIYPTKLGIVVFRADVTDRKQQEEGRREAAAKLQESEDRLRLATEAAAIGTFDYYPKTGELRLSDRAREILQLPSSGPIIYAAYVAAIHPDDRKIVHEIASGMHRSATDRYDIEYRTVHAGAEGDRWVAEKGRVLLDEAGQPVRFIGTLLDITAQKNAAILLERAKHDAEQASRAKDQFLAMLSHELRTPLTPVLMTIAALRRRADLDEEMQFDLEVLQRNVELEALLIDDLLDLTRIAHGKLQLNNDAVDIHASIEHALQISAADIAGKQLTVRRQLTATEHHSWADAARIQQVFWNLVKNAVKFTPAGGTIDVRTRNGPAHEIVAEIADSGVGIPPQFLSRIFDAFEQGERTTTSEFGGLGLGLAISKRVLDMHGGTIEAASVGVDQGATFTVTLQAMPTSLLDTPVVFLPTEPAGTAARILLVEDHEDTARVLRRILEHGGYEVAHANCVAAGRRLAETGNFDLVVSDLGLP
ncbi:MAG: ATP-binding protein, partial [Verrucomicrobiota bacterium]|nr:ATP-binding protein [Verrucomicrobiota bacterium]